MSTSYTINLTAEGEHEEMSVFIENLLGADNKFTPAYILQNTLSETKNKAKLGNKTW